MRRRFIYRPGDPSADAHGFIEVGDQVEARPKTPHIWHDLPEYRSPIDGRPVGGRVARREDLKRHGCIEIDPPREPRGYRNPSFALKRGLPLKAPNS